MRERVAWIALILVLTPLAQGQGERAAALVQYVEGASPPPPAALDAQLPATRVDADLLADRAPEGRPESALAHFRELQRLLLLRARTGSPLTLLLEGRTEGDELGARATPIFSDLADVELWVVLVEDGARVSLPEGEGEARFVARAREGPLPVRTPNVTEVRFRPDPAWRADRLHLVAYATSGGEAVQSAVWGNGDDAARQTSKLVLVEHATASWCQPCAPSDDAFALLASQQGEAGSARRDGYARAPDALALAGLALGALAAFALLRRRSA